MKEQKSPVADVLVAANVAMKETKRSTAGCLEKTSKTRFKACVKAETKACGEALYAESKSLEARE